MMEMWQVITMCKYVAILVYQALIEDVGVFKSKGGAAKWLSGKVEECGAEHCTDSLIWDIDAGNPIDIAFAH
jgi:hypothetical protein